MSRGEGNRRALVSWLQEVAIDARTFARLMGVSHVTVWYWCNGHRAPNRPRAHLLELLTGGAVPATGWLRQHHGGNHGRQRRGQRAA